MEVLELMKARHSVRQYLDKSIEEEKRLALEKEAEAINRESGLSVQILFNEKKCFDSLMAHYGKFSGVSNYISLVGEKGEGLEELCGYYGERLVLLAQSLGLNTCWVAMTHGKSAAKIEKGEKEVCLIALGYGKTQGTSHKVKEAGDVIKSDQKTPDWFRIGVEAALLAPTAVNQQKFLIEFKNGKAKATVRGFGFYSKVDLGIVKYHFEAATGKEIE